MKEANCTKKLLVMLVAASFCGITARAVAETEVGNGGAIVRGTCDGSDDQLVVPGEVLDFWEVRYRYGIEPAMGDATGSIDDQLETVFQRLQVVDVERAQLYRGWYQSFWREARDQEDRLPLPPLRDVGNVTPLLPAGCHLEKLIEQKEPESQVFAKRYFILRTKFNALSNTAQAGLILHEIVYRDALQRGHKTSMKARLVTGMLASDWLQTAAQEEYDQFMVEQGLTGYMANITPGTNFGLKRYFDQNKMSQTEAIAFCEHLKGDSRIAETGDISFSNSDYYGHQFRASAIGRRILGVDNSGSSIFWLSHAVGVNNRGYIDLGQSVPWPAPSERLPFICWQELKHSPWTE